MNAQQPASAVRLPSFWGFNSRLLNGKELEGQWTVSRSEPFGIRCGVVDWP